MALCSSPAPIKKRLIQFAPFIGIDKTDVLSTLVDLGVIVDGGTDQAVGNLFSNPCAEGNKGGDGTMGQGLVFVLKVFALNGPIGAFVSLCHQVNALIVAGQIQRFPYRCRDFLLEPNCFELGSVYWVVF